MPDPFIHTTDDGKVFALGARRRPPDPKQWAYELMPPAAVDRSRPRSLARFFPDVLNQGGEGSCVANASVAVQMALAAMEGVAPVLLSREDLYYMGRVKEGQFPADSGMYLADGFDCVLSNGGLPAETSWPYDASPAETPPLGLGAQPKYLYLSGHQPLAGANFVDGTIAALDKRQPLGLAFAFYQEFFGQFQQSGILSSAPAGQPVGGHAIAVWGWTPAQGGLLCCRNSWGATSPARTDLHADAKAGDIFLPIALCANGVVEEIRAATPVSAPPQPTPPAATCRAPAQALAQNAIDAAVALLNSTPNVRGQNFLYNRYFGRMEAAEAILAAEAVLPT